jgi:hypothetical protein
VRDGFLEIEIICRWGCKHVSIWFGALLCGPELVGGGRVGETRTHPLMFTISHDAPKLLIPPYKDLRTDVHGCTWLYMAVHARTWQCRIESGLHDLPAMRAVNALLSGRRWLQFGNSERKSGFYGCVYAHVHRPE